MKKIFAFTFVVFCTVCAFGQSNVEDDPGLVVSEDTVTVLEQMPEFPGGIPKLLKFLSVNVQYPTEAREAGITGKIVATFVVGADGMIRKVMIVKGIGYGCDEEVKRVIEAMPKWKPGVLDGKAVPVSYMLPVHFAF